MRVRVKVRLTRLCSASCAGGSSRAGGGLTTARSRGARGHAVDAAIEVPLVQRRLDSRRGRLVGGGRGKRVEEARQLVELDRSGRNGTVAE